MDHQQGAADNRRSSAGSLTYIVNGSVSVSPVVAVDVSGSMINANFSELARQLERAGVRVVYLFGPGTDRTMKRTVDELSRYRPNSRNPTCASGIIKAIEDAGVGGPYRLLVVSDGMFTDGLMDIKKAFKNIQGAALQNMRSCEVLFVMNQYADDNVQNQVRTDVMNFGVLNTGTGVVCPTEKQTTDNTFGGVGVTNAIQNVIAPVRAPVHVPEGGEYYIFEFEGTQLAWPKRRKLCTLLTELAERAPSDAMSIMAVICKYILHCSAMIDAINDDNHVCVKLYNALVALSNSNGPLQKEAKRHVGTIGQSRDTQELRTMVNQAKAANHDANVRRHNAEALARLNIGSGSEVVMLPGCKARGGYVDVVSCAFRGGYKENNPNIAYHENMSDEEAAACLRAFTGAVCTDWLLQLVAAAFMLSETLGMEASEITRNWRKVAKKALRWLERNGINRKSELNLPDDIKDHKLVRAVIDYARQTPFDDVKFVLALFLKAKPGAQLDVKVPRSSFNSATIDLAVDNAFVVHFIDSWPQDPYPNFPGVVIFAPDPERDGKPPYEYLDNPDPETPDAIHKPGIISSYVVSENALRELRFRLVRWRLADGRGKPHDPRLLERRENELLRAIDADGELTLVYAYKDDRVHCSLNGIDVATQNNPVIDNALSMKLTADLGMGHLHLCPVCWERPLSRSDEICANLHYVCSECVKNLKTCPLCRTTLP